MAAGQSVFIASILPELLIVSRQWTRTAAYWFTSSAAFANPAVTVGWMFSDTFAGIVLACYPDAGHGAGDVAVPHVERQRPDRDRIFSMTRW